MTLAEMDPMGVAVLVAVFAVVVAGVLWAWVADWRRDHLRKPGRLETPFDLNVEHLRDATPLTDRRRRVS